MTTNRSQPQRAGNATMDSIGMLGQCPEGMEEKGNLTDEKGKENGRIIRFYLGS